MEAKKSVGKATWQARVQMSAFSLLTYFFFLKMRIVGR
jgi:hypothetical protein